jgi:hypothetical protein
LFLKYSVNNRSGKNSKDSVRMTEVLEVLTQRVVYAEQNVGKRFGSGGKSTRDTGEGML